MPSLIQDLYIVVLSCALAGMLFFVIGPITTRFPAGYKLSRLTGNSRIIEELKRINFIERIAIGSICLVFSFFVIWAFFGHLTQGSIYLEGLTYFTVIVSSILLSLIPSADIRRLYEFLRSCKSINLNDLLAKDLDVLLKDFSTEANSDKPIEQIVQKLKSNEYVNTNTYVDYYEDQFFRKRPSLDDPSFITAENKRTVSLTGKNRVSWNLVSSGILIFAIVIPVCILAITFSRISYDVSHDQIADKTEVSVIDASYLFLKQVYKIAPAPASDKNDASNLFLEKLLNESTENSNDENQSATKGSIPQEGFVCSNENNVTEAQCVLDEYNHVRLSNPFLFIAAFLAIFSVLFANISFLFGLYQKKLLLRAETSSGLGLEIDAVSKIGGFIAFFVSALIALLMLDVEMGQLGLLTGIVAAGLTVALRETLGNLMAGMQLIWDRSLKKGDVVSIPSAASLDTGSTYGIVQQIKMRYTVIQDRNTVRRLIPNSILTANPIESWTQEDNRVRLSMRIGVNYDSDPRHVQKVMESVCYDVKRILITKPPQALLVAFDDSAITFSLRFWLSDTSTGIRPVVSEILINLLDRFKDEGINIPYPQRTIHVNMMGKDGKSRLLNEDVTFDPITGDLK